VNSTLSSLTGIIVGLAFAHFSLGSISLKRGSILAVFFLTLAASGQSAPVGSSSKSRQIAVTFFAMDRKDHPVADVKQGDLAILDNEQPVASIVSVRRSSELALQLGLLIDTSNSERASSLYRPGVRAAFGLLDQILSGPDDRVVVVRVSNEPQATAVMTRDELLKYKLDLTPSGRTALYDGISLAGDQITKVDTPLLTRRVLILLSDGDDDGSRLNRDEALAAALKAGVVVFAVSTEDDSHNSGFSDKGNRTLKQFADKTGGQAFLHLSTHDIDKVFAEIQEQIAQMYSVAFAPGDEVEKDFHPIKLTWSGPGTVRLRAPAGYYPK
jgi:Ca-activated chloride channel homolog